MAENVAKKPFKLTTVDRNSKKGVAVSSLDQLLDRASTLFGVQLTSVVLDEDGTEIVDEEYLMSLPDQTVLMVLQPQQLWDSATNYDETDRAAPTSLSALDILQRLHNNPYCLPLLSEEELETVAEADADGALPSMADMQFLADACSRELELRTKQNEALNFVKLCSKADSQKPSWFFKSNHSNKDQYEYMCDVHYFCLFPISVFHLKGYFCKFASIL